MWVRDAPVTVIESTFGAMPYKVLKGRTLSSLQQESPPLFDRETTPQI
jgi:hypothetical protein